MSNSINILYKNNKDIVANFLTELKRNADGINAGIFFDYFSHTENIAKLMDKGVEGTKTIFEETSKVQLNFTKRQMCADRKPGSKAEYSASKFLKLFSQRVLIAYCDML